MSSLLIEILWKTSHFTYSLSEHHAKSNAKPGIYQSHHNFFCKFMHYVQIKLNSSKSHLFLIISLRFHECSEYAPVFISTPGSLWVTSRTGASKRNTSWGSRLSMLSSEARVRSEPLRHDPIPGPNEPSVWQTNSCWWWWQRIVHATRQNPTIYN